LNQSLLCPKCQSAEVRHSEEARPVSCVDCGAAFTPPQQAKKSGMSDDHDRYAAFNETPKDELT